MEEIALTAVSYFFDLALAQINKEISESNFYNNDTLYKIAQGRYNMGTIAKDELLQMELSFLRSRKAFNEADLNLITIEQNRVDFEQEIFLEVARFNMQDEQLLIAAKSDTIAQIRYEITKQRFKVGKVSILDLNTALSEKDVARRDYVAAMRNYWNNYYNIRGYTLYDFLQKKRLTTDYRDLIEN
jgi:outer membrane protein TolC